MRIGRIYLNGFGIHRDRLFEIDQSAPAALFIGRNEAGKSTLMGFIRTMLFGFPTRAHMPDRYEPTIGGTHGGWMTLIDELNREIRVERYEKNGSLKLTFADGTEGGEAVLHSLLGGLTPDLFRNLFAFSLSELQKLETLHSDEVSSFLFSSGMGLSGSAILQAERKLGNQMEQLYKPRGSKQALNVALREIDSIETELRKSKEMSSVYNAMQEELQTIESQISSKDKEHDKARADREWFNKCRQTRESWLRLLTINRELSEMTPIEQMPEDALNRLEQYIIERESLLSKRDLIKIKQHELEQALSQMLVNDALIEGKVELEQLLQSAVIYQENRLSEIELSNELQSSQTALQRQLRQIDASWTVEQLKRFPTSITEREQIARYADLFTAISARSTVIYSQKESLALRQERIEQEAVEAKTAFDACVGLVEQRIALDEISDIEAYEADVKRGWDSIREQAGEWKYARRRQEEAFNNEHAYLGNSEQQKKGTVNQSPFPSLAAKVLTAVTGIALSIGLWLVWDEPIAAAILLFGFIGIYVMLFRRTSRADGNKNNDALLRDFSMKREAAVMDTDAELQQFHLRSARWMEMLRLTRIGDEVAADRAFEKANDPEAAIDVLTPMMEAINQAFTAWKRLQREQEQASQKLQMAEQSLAEWKREWMELSSREQLLVEEESGLKQRWVEWLNKYELNGDLLPDTIKLMMQVAEQGLQTNERMDQTATKLSAIKKLQYEFQQHAEQFLIRFGQPVPTDPSDLVFRLRRLKEETDMQIRMRDEQRQLAHKVEEYTHEDQVVSENLDRMQDKLTLLFEEAAVQDEAELRYRYSLFKRQTELKQEKRHSEVEVFAWVQPGQEERLKDTLTRWDADQIGALLEEAKQQELDLSAELNELKDSRGRLRNEIERIQSGVEHAALLHTHQERIAGFEQTAVRWMTLAMCAELIRKAREVYERDRQPGVLQQATKYFAAITDGMYSRVVSKLGEKTIFVEKANGERIDSAFLSRGTAEQLYLSMRFALADEYAKTVNMPLFMDDIFVNFDRSRLDKTLSVLTDVAQRRQVLLFTCHEHVVEAVRNALPETQLIDLNK